MNEERMKILEMVKEGKITVDEADKLLAAVGKSDNKIVRKRGLKKLRIRIYENGNFEKPKVNVNIPLSLARLAMKFIPEDAKAKINNREIDLDGIVNEVQEVEGERVELVNIEEENERVEIYIE